MQTIEIDHLSFAYGDEPVLSDICFLAEGEETIGIIGANGVGKSTLLKIMVGILPEYQGSLRICGMDVEKKNLAKIREKTGYVFQDSESQLFMSNVYEDVAFAPRNYGYSEEEVKKEQKKHWKWCIFRISKRNRFTGCPEDRKNWHPSPPFCRLIRKLSFWTSLRLLWIRETGEI